MLGAVLRHALIKEEIKSRVLLFGPEIMIALWPGGIGNRQGEPLDVEMPDGRRMTVTTEIVGQEGWLPAWGTRAEPAFWEWLDGQGAQTADSLLSGIETGARPTCQVTLERKTARDKTRIRDRDAKSPKLPLRLSRVIIAAFSSRSSLRGSWRIAFTATLVRLTRSIRFSLGTLDSRWRTSL